MISLTEVRGDIVRLPANAADFEKTPARMGFVVLATDRGIETELPRYFPDGFSFHVSRVSPYFELSEAEALAAIRSAASLLLPGAHLSAIGYGCSSGGFLLNEASIVEALTAGRPETPAVTVKRAIIDALQTARIETISLLTPYDHALTETVVRGFAEAGISIAKAGFLDLASDDEIAGLSPERIAQCAISLDSSRSEATVILCNALQAAGAIGKIAETTAKPVFSSTGTLVAKCINLISCQHPHHR
ncbi:hypothetical protein [Agrobacterium sp. LAD9]|uniref:maleate cis-trans isomerase family protein n=1 Tax=Agrobacterium sp. LAD9 TaxID=2055153 RepID=UPI00128FE1D5|nr:hypothetical protein [Agrobacterium sp. LAD9]